jgi:hypothetical protein
MRCFYAAGEGGKEAMIQLFLPPHPPFMIAKSKK